MPTHTHTYSSTKTLTKRYKDNKFPSLYKKECMHNLPWRSDHNLSVGSKMHDTQEKGYPATYSAVYSITTNTHTHIHTHALACSLLLSIRLSLCQQKHKITQTLVQGLVHCRQPAKVIVLCLGGKWYKHVSKFNPFPRP